MKKIIALTISMYVLNAYAIFCPNSFKSVDIGDTAEMVIAACGKPNHLLTYPDTLNVIQKWEYIKPHRNDKNTTKMTILMKDNKIIQININDSDAYTTQTCQSQGMINPNAIQMHCLQSPAGERSVSTTTLCGAPINLGDNAETVQFACGKPVIVDENKTTNFTHQITEFRYNSHPPVTFLFENGKLKEKK